MSGTTQPNGYDTLLLDRATWDLTVDSYRNIALASAPYSLVQDVASAIRLFIGELWYNRPAGIPYFEEILGHWPTLPVLKAHIERAAMTVPHVASARAFITHISSDRLVGGQVQITTDDGQSLALNEIFLGRRPAQTQQAQIGPLHQPQAIPSNVPLALPPP